MMILRRLNSLRNCRNIRVAGVTTEYLDDSWRCAKVRYSASLQTRSIWFGTLLLRTWLRKVGLFLMTEVPMPQGTSRHQTNIGLRETM